jgi:hypothetical protein
MTVSRSSRGKSGAVWHTLAVMLNSNRASAFLEKIFAVSGMYVVDAMHGKLCSYML